MYSVNLLKSSRKLIVQMRNRETRHALNKSPASHPPTPHWDLNLHCVLCARPSHTHIHILSLSLSLVLLHLRKHLSI